MVRFFSLFLALVVLCSFGTHLIFFDHDHPHQLVGEGEQAIFHSQDKKNWTITLLALIGACAYSFLSVNILRTRRNTAIYYCRERVNDAVKLCDPLRIALIRADFTSFIHTHGQLPRTWIDELFGLNQQQMHGILPEKFGPDIQGTITFSRSGDYYLIGKFRDNGKVATTLFPLTVK